MLEIVEIIENYLELMFRVPIFESNKYGCHSHQHGPILSGGVLHVRLETRFYEEDGNYPI